MAKYIFITGGVVSSLGKGLAAASLGALLQARGFKVRLRKLDPYLNVDPGTMSPSQHGEVYVTDDGGETDLDLGHYERFTGIKSQKSDNVTSGKIYLELLRRERKGDYLGATVQVIPHVTDLIKEFIIRGEKAEDFIICEIGGTVGDIEALPYFEAIRQLAYELEPLQSIFMHVTLVPYIKAAKELKTKPTQHSVKELRAIGITPNILLCRTEKVIPNDDKIKMAKFCNVRPQNVIQAPDLNNIYEAPLRYHQEGLDTQILKEFGINVEEKIDLSKWQDLIKRYNAGSKEINIAIVCKYMKVADAYKSLHQALIHAAIASNIKLSINWLDARDLMPSNVENHLKEADAIIVPGGFGIDGIEGKMLAINYARTRNVPYLGICYGMQLAVIEFMRNVCGIKNAESSEHGNNMAEHVVGLMTEWVQDQTIIKRYESTDLGGTMRLGSYPCKILPNSLASNIYNQDLIYERHRHRYEVNTKYKELLEQKGMKISGISQDGVLPEIIEIPENDYFIGVQFHPEFNSNPFNPNPLFISIVQAAARKK